MMMIKAVSIYASPTKIPLTAFSPHSKPPFQHPKPVLYKIKPGPNVVEPGFLSVLCCPESVLGGTEATEAALRHTATEAALGHTAAEASTEAAAVLLHLLTTLCLSFVILLLLIIGQE